MFPTAISLEQYEILRELSKNDGGVTYKALARENQSKVAIRVVVPGPGTSPDLAAIKHLASRACSLSSPYIVRVLESFEKEGAIYLVMEYTEGSFLSAALGSAKMSDWDMADFARQMCSAVDHAASLNIFHPNLHPANVIQEWDGTVKLLDYGVAADVVQRANMNPSWVRALQYVSPEQIRREPPDRRSNLFSLGVVLYEMVTGQNPFAGAAPAAIIEQITNKTPAAPNSLVKSVPAALSEVLVKALAKSPEERYQTGAELLHAIEHYRDQQTVVAKPAVSQPETKTTVGHTVAKPPERPSFTPPVAPPSPEPVFRPPVAAAPVMPKPPVLPKQAVPPARPTPPPVAKAMPPAPPVQAAPKPATPALKPTPRSEFLIIGPKKEDPVDAAVVSAPEKQAVTPAKQQSSLTSEKGSSAAPASEASIPTATIVVKPTPVAVAQPARDTAPAVIARPVSKLAVPSARTAVPVTSASPAPNPHVAKSTTSTRTTKTNNRLVLILVGVGALGIIVLGAVLLGLYLGRNRNATQEQKPAPLPAPVQQPVAEVQAPIQEEPQPEQTEPSRKKKKEAPKPVVANVPVLGTAYVSTTPEGATIELDGQATPFVTPKALFNLSAGSHAIRVSKAGFEPTSRTVQVEGGQTASVNIALAEVRATLAISSYPDGAAITINGEKTGRVTPATVSLVKGRYVVILQKDGYVPSENTLEVLSGQSYRLSPRMSAMGNAEAAKEVGKFKKLFGGGNQAEMGKVQFRTAPKGAQVTANGKIMKKQTPMELLFPAGVYELVFTLPGYKPARRTITVAENSNQVVDVQLERESK